MDCYVHDDKPKMFYLLGDLMQSLMELTVLSDGRVIQ